MCRETLFALLMETLCLVTIISSMGDIGKGKCPELTDKKCVTLWWCPQCIKKFLWIDSVLNHINLSAELVIWGQWHDILMRPTLFQTFLLSVRLHVCLL